MTTTTLVALVSTAFVVAGTVIYIVHAVKNPQKPVFASWVVMCSTNLLAFITYWTTREHSLVGNITNTGGLASSFAIFLTVARSTWKTGKRPQFSPFQRGCLKVALGIFALWLIFIGVFSWSGLVPNLLTQLLMVIGYIVTVENLLNSREASEPKYAWACIAISCVAGLYPALVKADMLAGLYSMRAIVSSATMVYLIYRVERKSRRSP